MKKIVVLFFGIMLSSMLHAQTIMTDSLMLAMKKYLYDNESASDATTISRGNLWIDRFWPHSYEPIYKGDTINRIDFLTFNSTTCLPTEYVFCVLNDKYFIINLYQTYDKVLKDLLRIFEQNPDIDESLLPLFNHLLYRIFIRNTRWPCDHGVWDDWWHPQNSLYKQLNVQYDDWL